ncbi:Type IV pilus biogenesis and competence protein pilQ precursor [Plesiomonas shigelloides]|uniref:type IV pilus secretin PilQ n=1 Tax=Plesiomonas shigelloides TaxID=703 RepID=UPI0007F096DF|nr:type IV pilus secretin PilQ family protein [Plesiomonas shigelloides]SBT59803.1 Type IV pilus biogenesis and competence protein pilQ precursor [Plesiomonas shigelloides]
MMKGAVRSLRYWMVAGVWFGLMSPAWAATLEDVKLRQEGDRLAVSMIFDQPVATPAQQRDTLANTLALTFSQVDKSKLGNTIRVNNPMLRGINIKPSAKGTKIGFDLVRQEPFELRAEGKSYILLLGQTRSTEQVQQNNPILKPTGSSLLSVDFVPRGDGQAELTLNFVQPPADLAIRQSSGRLVLDLPRTTVAGDAYKMDVSRRGTPVKTIRSEATGQNTRLLLDLKGPVDYDQQRIGSQVKVQIRRANSARAQVNNPAQYSKPISLNFQNVPIRTVLQVIADYNQFNLVTTDSVQGEITLRLDNVPWQQALDIILRAKGLDKRIDGNVLLVAPSEVLIERERREMEADAQVSELKPLQTEYIDINFAKASEIAAMLTAPNGRMLSSRGSVSVDERTNTLLVRDIDTVLDTVRQMVASLDRPVSQIQIEARIVTINDESLDELGVRWGMLMDTGNGGMIGGSVEGNLGAIGALDQKPTVDDFLNVNMPASSGAASIAFQIAKINGKLLDLELSALERENNVEIVASPRLLTANKKQASIKQGTELPYEVASSSGASTIEFKDAVLGLDVTPQITPNGQIILDLKVSQNSPGKVYKIGRGEAVSVDKQEVETQVLVDDGETVVLGGVFQHTTIKGVDKVPVLGDIPVMGRLFRRDMDKAGKRELVIFVTPRVVQQNMNRPVSTDPISG